MTPGGGGGGQGVGVDPQGGQPAGPAAADSVVGPLTEVLEKLSIAVDPSSTSKKLQGMIFKPEYYVQHIKKGIALKQVDNTKLSYRDIYICIYIYLQKKVGRVLPQFLNIYVLVKLNNPTKTFTLVRCVCMVLKVTHTRFPYRYINMDIYMLHTYIYTHTHTYKYI